jgi:hypothetical protein
MGNKRGAELNNSLRVAIVALNKKARILLREITNLINILFSTRAKVI